MKIKLENAHIVPGKRRLATVIAMAMTLFAFAMPALQAPITQRESYGIQADRPAPDFQLHDQTGQARSLSDFRGKYVFLMFGFLSCENICHTQALLFEELNMSEHGKELAFIYVAIDPQRDSPQQVARYFDSRGENFVSLHGDDTASLQRFANQYRAYFSHRGNGQRSDYTIDHNGLFYLIGPDGRLSYIYGPGQNATPEIIADLDRLKSRQNNRSTFLFL